MSSGWKSIASAPSVQGERQMILVWHDFLGVMVSDTEHCRENRFHRYWMDMPDGWIDRNERFPTQSEADRHNCVIIRDRHGNTGVRGWYQVEASKDIQQWMPPPPPPETVSAPESA